jgi:DNA gyrase/topoisomerase IV subunit A
MLTFERNVVYDENDKVKHCRTLISRKGKHYNQDVGSIEKGEDSQWNLVIDGLPVRVLSANELEQIAENVRRLSGC